MAARANFDPEAAKGMFRDGRGSVSRTRRGSIMAGHSLAPCSVGSGECPPCTRKSLQFSCKRLQTYNVIIFTIANTIITNHHPTTRTGIIITIITITITITITVIITIIMFIIIVNAIVISIGIGIGINNIAVMFIISRVVLSSSRAYHRRHADSSELSLLKQAASCDRTNIHHHHQSYYPQLPEPIGISMLIKPFLFGLRHHW